MSECSCTAYIVLHILNLSLWRRAGPLFNVLIHFLHLAAVLTKTPTLYHVLLKHMDQVEAQDASSALRARSVPQLNCPCMCLVAMEHMQIRRDMMHASSAQKGLHALILQHLLCSVKMEPIALMALHCVVFVLRDTGMMSGIVTKVYN